MGSGKTEIECKSCGYPKYVGMNCPHCGWTLSLEEKVAEQESNKTPLIFTVLALLGGLYIVWVTAPGDYLRSLFNGGDITVIGTIEVYKERSDKDSKSFVKLEQFSEFNTGLDGDRDQSYKTAMDTCLNVMGPRMLQVARNYGFQVSAPTSDFAYSQSGVRGDKPRSASASSYIPFGVSLSKDVQIQLVCRKKADVPDYVLDAASSNSPEKATKPESRPVAETPKPATRTTGEIELCVDEKLKTLKANFGEDAAPKVEQLDEWYESCRTGN